MHVKTLSALALLAALPAAAMAQDVQYGYEKSSNTTTDDSGATTKTTEEQSWATQQDGGATAPVTDVNAPADAQPSMATTQTQTTTESVSDDAGGQHSKAWYNQHLQQSGRYTLDPDTNKLVPVADDPTIHKLNHAARTKDDTTDNNQ